MCTFCVLLRNFQISYYKYVLCCNQIKINVIKMKKMSNRKHTEPAFQVKRIIHFYFKNSNSAACTESPRLSWSVLQLSHWFRWHFAKRVTWASVHFWGLHDSSSLGSALMHYLLRWFLEQFYVIIWGFLFPLE